MKVFIIGAAGGIGNRLSSLLHARGDAVSGMHRNPEQASKITDTGATAVLGDLIHNSTEELTELFRGHNAIVFSAGAHGTGQENTTLIDGAGLRKAADAASAANVSRFILVSAFPESSRGEITTENFEHYMKVKKSADVYLSHTDLDWVIVRPGVLQDEAGDGLVTAGLAINYGNVARDNVAAFIDEALHQPQLSKIIVELTDGSTPVAEAVERLIK